MPTIIDVARHSEVSIATVSRVMSRPDLVRADTRDRVLRSVAELGYTPNRAARALRTLRAAKILVTVPDISNPFFAAVIRGAEEAARQAGYAVVLGDTRHDPLLENRYAAMLSQREVDGLIFLGHRLPDSLRPLIEDEASRAAIVNGCEYSPELRVPSVHIDNAQAGSDGLDHLVGLGHRAIGIITGPMASPISRDRLDGVQRAAARHGGLPGLAVRYGDYSAASGHGEAKALIEAGSTAIFCFSDEMAVGVLQAIEDAGLRCPADVSVLGFDDISLARYMRPGLTTLAQPKEEIGCETVRLLLAVIDGTPIVQTITLDHRLVIRGSTGRIRVDRGWDDMGIG